MWCDLGFIPNSRGNEAAANLRPIPKSNASLTLQQIEHVNDVLKQTFSNFVPVPTAYTMEEGRAVYQFSIDMLIRDCELPFDAESLFKRIGLDASDWTLMMMEVP